MTPERWKQIRDLFDAAVERSQEERTAFLQQACGPDQELRGEVDSLLDAHAGSSRLMAQPAAALAAASLLSVLPRTARPEEAMEGRRLGPYKILRRIGSGGMGSVYAAARADEQFEKIVAVKIVKPGLDNATIVRRFRNERQVLASLEHPNIGRLLDGGTTSEGLPYLVMEYIEGTPLDQYCDHHRLSVAERLALFRVVCEAVHCAHQNLVVHRDLKPGNILVTAQGVPKLLDFGIAKLLRPEYSNQALGQTTPGTHPMTPKYASPEQVRGEPITTASDQYSLGVLLYLLLTGQSPYGRAESRGDLIEAICEADPEAPSEVASRLDPSPCAGRSTTPRGLAGLLRGDLDAILLTTLRKEPQRRYASVERLSEDIRKHLFQLPVSARNLTTAYRVHKFILRHTAAVAAAILVSLALLASTVTSAYYARTARREKVIAERRFQDVRQLARFVLLEFDDAIRSGETSARKVLLDKGLDYLHRLSLESAGDPQIQSELMDGYLKVGDVQNNLYGPHLGERAGAKQSYRKALEIAGALADAEPANQAARRNIARASGKLGDLAALGGDRKEALDHYRRALGVFEALAGKTPAGEARRDIVEITPRIGLLQYQIGDLRGALASYSRSLALAEQWTDQDARNPEARRAFALASYRVGEMMARSGQTQAGLERLRRGLATFEDLLTASPTSPEARRDLSAVSLVYGDILSTAGMDKDAIESFRRALSLSESLAREDPRNKQYQRDVCAALGRLADLLAKAGQMGEARVVTQRALAELRELVDLPEASEFDLQQYVWLLVTTPLADLRNPHLALPYASKAVALTNGTDPRTLDMLALAYHGAGDTALAITAEEHALALVPPARAGEAASDLRKDLEANLALFRKAMR